MACRTLSHALVFCIAFAIAPAFAQLAATGGAPQIGQVSKDSVWVPTPDRMIRRMLQIADTGSGDVVFDLGSGDGRVPIYAARHFGVKQTLLKPFTSSPHTLIRSGYSFFLGWQE